MAVCMKKTLLLVICLVTFIRLFAEDGYRLWLRYDRIEDAALLQQYNSRINSIVINGNSPTIVAAKNELLSGLQGLLGKKITVANEIKAGTIVLQKNPGTRAETIGVRFEELGDEGFAILSYAGDVKNVTIIAGNTDIGILYGVFHFLRLLQTRQSID